MERKYELVKEDSIEIDGRELYRIKALRDFGDVKKGDLGGYIEKEDNLSHEGNCWIYNNAIVFGNAMVSGNARVFDNAMVFGNAVVCGNARVFGDAMVYDNANVSGNAQVYGNARVFGDAMVFDNARVSGNARVYGYAMVYGHTHIYGYTHISNDANISSKDNYLYIVGLGSENRDTTFFRCTDDIIKVNCGCFNGTLDQFINEVNITHKDNDKYRREYLSIVETIKIHFNIE